MKANEIQIGDWLYYKGQFNAFPFKVESITKKKVGYHAEPNEHRMHYLRLSECKPIPLTPEILEKNGFEKVYDKYKLPNYRIKWKSYTDFYFTVFTGVDGYWNPIGLNVITGGIPATVDYVHQLQNALRLCGIKKEIVL